MMLNKVDLTEILYMYYIQQLQNKYSEVHTEHFKNGLILDHLSKPQ